MASANSQSISESFTSTKSVKKEIVKVKTVQKDILKPVDSSIYTKDANSESIVPLNTVKTYKLEKFKIYNLN